MIAKELQREAVRGKLIHVDFYEVDLSTKIEVSVPIHLTGTPEGVVLGGVLDQQMRDVTLMCLPNAIPDSVDFDVSGMELGDSLHVSDLGVADGVDIATESELTVATVLIPRGLRDSANADGDEAGDEGADDASGEGDEGGEG